MWTEKAWKLQYRIEDWYRERKGRPSKKVTEDQSDILLIVGIMLVAFGCYNAFHPWLMNEYEFQLYGAMICIGTLLIVRGLFDLGED